ncbi:hypothetical protein ACFY4B_27365 [Kitasatospora sp. NPDC001261]|uniref:hypothetical protein n=1 Tax=Kitasatospora sp. NPDC001261 TaxID=3364012 RepID=UPI0036816E21
MTSSHHAAARPRYRHWRHRAHAALPWAYLAMAILVWLQTGALYLLLAAGYLAVRSAEFWHRRELCEWCIAAVPLDAAAAAERRRHVLRPVHHWRLNIAADVVLLLLLFVLPLGSTAGSVAQSAGWVMLGYFAVARIQHNQLQPWCPWCQDGNGWEEDLYDDPDPAGGLHEQQPDRTSTQDDQ